VKTNLLFILALLNVLLAQAQSAEKALHKGNEHYRQQQFALAEKQYKEALEEEADHAKAQYNLANALYQQKRYSEAHAVLKKLNGSTGDKALKAATHYNQGVIYTKEKALEASIEAYKAALRIDPSDTQARENLQKALAEQKKQQQQKKEQEKKQQQKKNNMSQKEAEQKLKLLQEREKQLQERLQQGGQKGNAQPKDW
jgi:Ca-activated chloride channel family protein